jgi:2-phosphoglycerate kinase
MDKVQKEVEKLKLQIEKNQQNLKQHKQVLIKEIKSTQKLIVETKVNEEEKYSLWKRIKKTLGIT